MQRQTQIVVALILSCSLAQARSAAVKTAKMHYAEGKKAFDIGEFERAIASFKAAYDAKPDPVFLFNTAQAYRLAKDFEHAVFFYRSFLQNQADTPNRVEIERRIDELERSLAEARAEKEKEKEVPSAPPAHFNSQTDNGAAVTRRPLTSGSPPTYKKWWVWTIVGGIAVGTALGVGLGIGLSSPSAHFGVSTFE